MPESSRHPPTPSPSKCSSAWTAGKIPAIGADTSHAPCAASRDAPSTTLPFRVLQSGDTQVLMPDTAVPIGAETVLEVVSPDGARRFVRVAQTPFLIGRGAETGN